MRPLRLTKSLINLPKAAVRLMATVAARRVVLLAGRLPGAP
jgi:hypothetical protein